ncbi:hypothetical protein MKX03_030314 [Papaver bracteatum]|nr:hypothetical protein MKX03_030314 [Papaver bracteatum]
MKPQTSSKLAVVILTSFVVLVATTSSRSTRTTAEAEETLNLSSSIHNFIRVNKIDDRDSKADDQSSIKEQMGATGCCDLCPCTKSIPPQCQCTDIKPQCHAKCKACRCTRSQPPRCRCMDKTSFCYPKCSSSPTTHT